MITENNDSPVLLNFAYACLMTAAFVWQEAKIHEVTSNQEDEGWYVGLCMARSKNSLGQACNSRRRSQEDISQIYDLCHT